MVTEIKVKYPYGFRVFTVNSKLKNAISSEAKRLALKEVDIVRMGVTLYLREKGYDL